MATRAEREREKKASLLAAAEEVFTSKGYTDATLDEIIKLADTGKGTVYRYFGNKENLVNCKLNLNTHNQETHSIA